MKKVFFIVVLALMVVVFFACQSTDTCNDSQEGQNTEEVDTVSTEIDADALEDQLKDLNEESNDTALIEEEVVAE